MDNELSANDPYRKMDTGEEGIKPDFLKNKSGTAQKVLGAAEQVANVAMAAKGGGKVGGGLKTGSATEKAAMGERNPKGLYSGGKGLNESKTRGEKGENESSLRMPAALKMMAPLLLVFLALFGVLALTVALPVIMIGAIDYNLQKALGFFGTVGILEEQGEYVTAEIAKSGDFPSKYSSDLASNGLDVGQVTANGEFIKTDTYIANIEERDDLVAAASGFTYSSDEEGELAFLYNGNIIKADDFVAAVESDPKLYAAYSKSADIAVKYYYGKDVSKVYKSMKLSRGSFNEWEATGDYKTDEESYKEILETVLDGKSTSLSVGGVHDDTPPLWGTAYEVVTSWFRPGDKNAGGNFRDDISEGDAEDITEKVAGDTKKYIKSWYLDTCERQVPDENGGTKTEYYTCQKPIYDETVNQRAAELLNTTISAKEPYLASSVFLAVEEPIQRARIGDNGPVNQLMNTLSTPTSVTYRDVKTGDTVTKNVSILETVNFQAAVGERPYSTDEAASFTRDRVLQVTGLADDMQEDGKPKASIIRDTTVTMKGKKQSGSVVRNGDNSSADMSVIGKANDSVSMAISQKNSDLFESIVGGNRVLEGGSFLSNNVNQKVIGAMPSDAGTIASYQTELDKVIARKEEADRASLSPFDISSPNTFLGSIVHNLATSMVGNYGSGSTMLFSTLRAAGNAAGDAVASLTGAVTAEGANQQYTSLSPDYCTTVKDTIDVEGDLYCTAHNTVSTEHMAMSLNDWKKSNIGSSLEDKGKIKEDSELEQFVVMGMDRSSTVGTMNAEVCKAYHNYYDELWDDVFNFFTNVVGLYQVCNGIPKDVSVGNKYSFTDGQDDKLDLYSGYMLYNEVRSLLTEEDTAVALVRDRYYAEHPRDDSEAGEIARISGMTKSEAEIVLAYADYLTYIANYDASDRYAFGSLELNIEKPILVKHSDAVMENLYAWHRKEIEYDDTRNREVATA